MCGYVIFQEINRDRQMEEWTKKESKGEGRG